MQPLTAFNIENILSTPNKQKKVSTLETGANYKEFETPYLSTPPNRNTPQNLVENQRNSKNQVNNVIFRY